MKTQRRGFLPFWPFAGAGWQLPGHASQESRGPVDSILSFPPHHTPLHLHYASTSPTGASALRTSAAICILALGSWCFYTLSVTPALPGHHPTPFPPSKPSWSPVPCRSLSSWFCLQFFPSLVSQPSHTQFLLPPVPNPHPDYSVHVGIF